MTTIIGISVSNRVEDAQKLQDIFTKYGCFIKTRIGLHDMADYKCLNYGVILIQVVDRIHDIYQELSRNWEVQIMKF